MAISKKSWLGIARETTPGTAITSPTHYIPCKSTLKNVQKREYLMEERGTRDKEYDVVNTIRSASWDVKGPFYPDAHAYFLLGAMGSVSSMAQSDATVYKHTFALADIPPSFTLMKSFDAATYYSPYSVVEKFTLKLAGAEKLIEMDASGQGIWMQKQSTPPSPTIPDTKPFAGYAPTITLTSGASSDIIDLEIDFTQKVSLFYPANGQPDFVTAYFGEREASFKFTARFDNDTLYQRFLQGQGDTLTFDVQGPIISTTFHSELNIALPNISYDSMEHDLSKENVLVKAAGKAVVAGGSNLMTAFVQNLITSYAS